MGVPSQVKTPEFGGRVAPDFRALPFPKPCSLCLRPQGGTPPDLPALCPPASNAQYIVSGSDDGSFFIWEKETTNLVRVLQGDESIVNCLQPHPSYCFLATSGIDPVVRLWNPRPEVRVWQGGRCQTGRKVGMDPMRGLQLSPCGLGRAVSHTEARSCSDE